MDSTLVGRAAERDALARAWDRTRRGRGALVIVEGEAGIGKTSLATSLARDVVSEGAMFLIGRVDLTDSARPYGPLARALGLGEAPTTPTRRRVAELLDRRARVAPEPAVSGPDLDFQIEDLLTDLLESSATRAPVLLVLDDLQWADDGTLRTLGRLARRVATERLLVLALTRPRPAGALASSWSGVADLAALTLRLERLSDPEVRSLVAARLGADPTGRLLELLAGAAGVPYFVRELADVFAERGLLEYADGRVGVREGHVEAIARDDTLAGLQEIDEETLSLLRLASVFGRSFSPSALAELTDSTAAALAPSLLSAIDRGLLVDGGDQLVFRHELVRDALYRGVPEAIRQGWHGDAARVLRGRGRPAHEVASQLVLAGPEVGGDEVVDQLLLGADEIQRTSPTTSATWLERALVMVPVDDDRRPEIQARLAHCYLHAGRHADALRTARSELLRDPGSRPAYRLETSIAQLAFLDGRLVEAGAALVDLGRRPVGTLDERGLALVDAAMAHLLTGQLDEAPELADEARRLRSGAPAVEVYALGVMALAEGLRGRLDAAETLATRGVELAVGAGDRRALLNLPYLLLAQVELWAYRFDEAREALGRGRAISTELGLGWDAPLYQTVAGELRLETGEWDDAIAETEAALSYADDLGSHLLDAMARSRLAEISVYRNELDAAEEYLRQGLDDSRRSDGQGLDLLLRVQALVLEARGDLAGSASTLQAVWDQLVRLGASLRLFELGPDLCRLALATGRERAAREAVDQLAAAAPEPAGRAAATRHWCRGLVERSPDLLGAVAESGHLTSPVRLALLRADHARALAQAGRSSEAREPRHLSGKFLRRLGADGLLARYGMARDPATTGARFGWEALTPSERRVVELVGRGLSNAQIAEEITISRRTVESHLYHVYPKLGLGSRVELAVEAARRSSHDQ